MDDARALVGAAVDRDQGSLLPFAATVRSLERSADSGDLKLGETWCVCVCVWVWVWVWVCMWVGRCMWVGGCVWVYECVWVCARACYATF